MNIHILFGESTAGGLKWALRDINPAPAIKIIAIPDHFSIGPIFQMDTDFGIENRAKWLKDHLLEKDFYENQYVVEFKQTLQEIDEIHNETVTIWTADNAPEQTGLRFMCKLLEKKKSSVRVINTNKSYNQYCKQPDIYYTSLHSGEIPPHHFRTIFEKTQNNKPISENDRIQLLSDWEKLSNNHEVLRIWEDKKIKSVGEDYFDSFIINSARRLEWKYGNEFKKSARLIGDVIAHLEQYVGDRFIQYRLFHLIKSGIFEYEGTLDSMRNYSVRLVNQLSAMEDNV